LQKHMKPHCVHYILYRDIGYGTLCSTALSIGVVSARGSEEINRSCERYLLVSVVTVFSVYYIGSSLLAYLTIQTKYGLKYANFLLLIYLSATLLFVYFIIRNFQIRSSFKK